MGVEVEDGGGGGVGLVGIVLGVRVKMMQGGGRGGVGLVRMEC